MKKLWQAMYVIHQLDFLQCLRGTKKAVMKEEIVIDKSISGGMLGDEKKRSVVIPP